MTLDTATFSALFGVLAILIAACGWFLSRQISRVDDKLDKLPEQFAQVHARISDGEKEHAALAARIETHLEHPTRGT